MTAEGADRPFGPPLGLDLGGSLFGLFPLQNRTLVHYLRGGGDVTAMYFFWHTILIK